MDTEHPRTRAFHLAYHAKQAAELLNRVVGDVPAESAEEFVDWAETVAVAMRQQFEEWNTRLRSTRLPWRSDENVEQIALEFESLMALGNATAMCCAEGAGSYTDRSHYYLPKGEWAGALIALVWNLERSAGALHQAIEDFDKRGDWNELRPSDEAA